MKAPQNYWRELAVMTFTCCWVATAERGLCGGFNSNIAKLAMRHANDLIAKGKTVKILCVGRKGYDSMKREHKSRMIDGSPIDFKQVKKMSFAQAESVGRKVLKMFDDGEFDVCTLYYSEFQSVISQIPTGQLLIPARIVDDAEGEEETGAAGAEAAYEYEPDEAEILADLLPRNCDDADFPGLAGERCQRAGRAHVGQWTMPPEMLAT